jgi:hypothetical protein
MLFAIIRLLLIIIVVVIIVVAYDIIGIMFILVNDTTTVYIIIMLLLRDMMHFSYGDIHCIQTIGSRDCRMKPTPGTILSCFGLQHTLLVKS